MRRTFTAEDYEMLPPQYRTYLHPDGRINWTIGSPGQHEYNLRGLNAILRQVKVERKAAKKRRV